MIESAKDSGHYQTDFVAKNRDFPTSNRINGFPLRGAKRCTAHRLALQCFEGFKAAFSFLPVFSALATAVRQGPLIL